MTDPPVAYRLYTLGRLALVGPGVNEDVVLADAKPLAVLAVLAWEGPRRPEQITELLWPDADRERATASLRQALYTLSQAAGTPLVERSDGLLALDPSLAVDLRDFREAIEDEDHEYAIRVYGGHFLGGYEAAQDRRFVQWAEAVDDWVEVHLQQAFDRVVEAALRAEDVDRAVKLAEGFRAHFPLVTQAVGCLVIALRAAGRLRAALAEIGLFEQRLAQELDEPLPDELADFRAVLEAELRNELNEVGAEVAENRVAVGTGPADPSTDTARSGPAGSSRRSTRRWWTAAAIGGLAVAAGLIAAVVGGPDTPQLVLPAQAARGAAQVVLNQEGARIVELNRDRRWRIPSSRGMIARTVRSSTGIDTELEMPDGTRRMILTERADEVPLGWSPDGRYLLYRHVIATDRPPGYEQRLAVWDAGTGEARIVYGRPGMPLGYFTPWCPTASRIALEVGPEHATAVVVIDLAGAELSRIAPGGLSLSFPAWSPDGTRLAFVGTREGEADIYVAGWDGSGLRRIGATPSAEQTPVWLSDLHVAAVTVGPAPRLVVQSTRGSEAVSVPLGQPVRLLSTLMVEWPENATELVSGLIRSLEARQDAALPAVWLANLSIDGHEIASPGEYVAYRLTGKDPRGRSSGLLPPAVEWSVGDSTVLRSLGEGRFRALRPGSTYVRGRLPGWEGDSLLVTVRRPRALDPPVLFQEDWTAEIREDRWIPYGEPVPEVVPAGPDATPAFDNRGDQNYNSGVISRRAFPLAGGLTVEAWIRLVPTGEGFQSASVYLSRGDATALDPDGMPAAGEVAGFDLSGTNRLTQLFGHGHRTAPLPEGVHGWLRYTIQVHPDGSQALLVDGNVYLRGSGPDPSGGPVHLELGGRSLTSTVLIGPLTVYGGLRYEID